MKLSEMNQYSGKSAISESYLKAMHSNMKRIRTLCNRVDRDRAELRKLQQNEEKLLSKRLISEEKREEQLENISRKISTIEKRLEKDERRLRSIAG